MAAGWGPWRATGNLSSSRLSVRLRRQPVAKVNVFEGSRRLALLLKLVWLIGVAGVTWSAIPSSVYIHFVTDFPTEPFRLVTDNCRSGTDALEFVSRNIGEGRTAQVQLCFAARRSDEGRHVVPYRVDANGTWW